MSYLLVSCQALGMLLCCIPFASANNGPTALLLLSAIGAGLGIATLCFNKLGNFSVFPEIKTGAELIMQGPYRYIRHPMYTALVLVMAGIAGYNGDILNYLGVVLVVIAVFLKANLEERYLRQRFPHYAEYAAMTKRFFPFFY